jgi:hypothetical protein
MLLVESPGDSDGDKGEMSTTTAAADELTRTTFSVRRLVVVDRVAL